MALEFLPGCTGDILAKERLRVHSLAGRSLLGGRVYVVDPRDRASWEMVHGC